MTRNTKVSQSMSEKRREILRSHGIVKEPQKLMMLKKWASRYESFKHALLDLYNTYPKCLRPDWKQDFGHEGTTSEEIMKAICTRVPDRDWLKFARLKLKLQEKEIRKIRETCEMTTEQRYQLSKRFRRSSNGLVVN